MHARTGALALAALSLLASPTLAGDELWFEDYDEAAKVAVAEGKDLLVDFTGSDWCVWCLRLDEEVFAHDEFLVAVQEHFVLVKLDFPRGDEAKAQVPNPERNQELFEDLGVSSFPTVLLMTAGGDAYGETGYRPDGPVAYVEHLDELRTKGRVDLEKALGLVNAFAAAEGHEAKVAAAEGCIELLASFEGNSPVARRVAGPVRAALELDPQNAAGLKLRAVRVLVTSSQADAKVLATARELDPKNELGVLEIVVLSEFQAVRSHKSAFEALAALDALIELGFHDQELAFELLYTAARWSKDIIEDDEQALRYAKRALEIESSEEEVVEYLRGLVAESE